MLVFPFPFRCGSCPRVTPRLNMSVAIGPEMIITNGVFAPIRMASFPTVKTFQPEWVSDQPDIAGSQIEILVTHETHIFDTIPSITVRNQHWLRRFSLDDDWLERHPSRLNYAT